MANDLLDALQDRIGHRFRNRALLESALTHPSAKTAAAVAAAADGAGYERLEFLGDRVLGLAVAELLTERFPTEDEGALSKRLTALVRKEALIAVADEIRIDEALDTAAGDGRAYVRQQETAKADGVEALLGALFLDAGFTPVRKIVRRWWTPLLARHAAPPKDPKTTLQEWAQARSLPLPNYEVLSAAGPDHQPTFVVRVTIEGAPAQEGQGRSKRVAQQAAATLMLSALSAEASE